MPNHWHFVLQPMEDGVMSNFLQWVSLTHTMRLHAHYGTGGQRHVHQGQLKSFPVQDDEHFLLVCRYVARNALRAGLVRRAEEGQKRVLTPFLRPAGTAVTRTAIRPQRDSDWHILFIASAPGPVVYWSPRSPRLLGS